MDMFSFITVCYNDEKVLKKTMESILSIESDNYEYIIVDGASKDGTVSLLKEYEGKFNGKMRWISEKDNGIYDAMNKGIQMSKGKYLSFINANDVFCSDSLTVIEKELTENRGQDIDIIYGNTVNVYNTDGCFEKVVRNSNANITLKSLRRGMGVVHQSMFTSKALFDRIGAFNVEYTIGADWDFLIRSVKSNAILKYVPCSICEFDVNGVSSGLHNMQRHKIRKANRLYRVIDIDLFKDVFNPKVLVQLFIGKENYQKLRYKANKKHNQ